MKNKIDFSFFIQAKNANPNGDPDMGNLPRIDEETMIGFISDVSIKKNIRNYIENAFAGVDGIAVGHLNGGYGDLHRVRQCLAQIAPDIVVAHSREVRVHNAHARRRLAGIYWLGLPVYGARFLL